MIRLSVYLVVQDEELRIRRTMDALAKVADEIVVVDSGSTDNTENIVREYTDRFFYNKFISIGHQVKVAEELCSNKWVLRLDADEELSEGLIDEILSIKENPDCDGYFLRIGEVFPGYSRPNRWVKHYKLIRLYNREKMSMSGKHGHDDVIFSCKNVKTRLLKNFVNHYSFISINQIINKYNIESSRLAERAILQHKRYSPLRMLGCISGNMLKYFILGRYFLFGWWGFIHSWNLGVLRFLKFAKYYEAEQAQRLGK